MIFRSKLVLTLSLKGAMYHNWPACCLCDTLADMSDGFVPVFWVRYALTKFTRAISEIDGKALFESRPTQSLYVCPDCNSKHPNLVLTLGPAIFTCTTTK